MMHSPRVSDSPHIFDTFLDFLENFTNVTFSRKNFPFSSAKISDDLFLVIDPQIFGFPPYFPVLVHSPSDSRKFIISPTFQSFPPVFQKFNSILHTLRVFFPPTLTMMHLCITQCTYWTPLSISSNRGVTDKLGYIICIRLYFNQCRIYD